MDRFRLAAAVVARNEIKTVHAQLERALVAVEEGRPRVLRIRRVSPRAVLPDHLQVVEIKTGGLRVGRVGLGLFVDKDAALRNHARRPTEAEHPAHRVEHVNAHVADDPVAVLHERAPTPGVTELIVGTHRGRAGPHLVVQILRHRGILRGASVAHVIVAANLRMGDVTEQPGVDDLFLCFHQVRGAASLSAHLHNAIVLACRCQHRLTFHHVDARRFLHVHIAARLDGIDHRQCVPVIRCGDQNQIKVVLLEQRPVVGVGLGAFA